MSVCVRGGGECVCVFAKEMVFNFPCPHFKVKANITLFKILSKNN